MRRVYAKGPLLRWKKALVRGRWAVFWYHSIVKGPALQNIMKTALSKKAAVAKAKKCAREVDYEGEDKENRPCMSLEEALEALLLRQERSTNPGAFLSTASPSSSPNKDQLCTEEDKRAAVGNIQSLNAFFGLPPDVMALSVYLLDKFLSKVKARTKHMYCIGLSCFYLATRYVTSYHRMQVASVCLTKVPSLADIVVLSQSVSITESDVARMARYIGEKINIDEDMENAVTALDFLRLFYTIITDNLDLQDFCLPNLVAKLKVCFSRHLCCREKCSALALSIAICELEDVASEDLRWMTLVVGLQNYCKISDAEVVHSRSLVADTMETYLAAASVVPRQRLTWRLSARTLRQLVPPSHRLPATGRLPAILEGAPDTAA